MLHKAPVRSFIDSKQRSVIVEGPPFSKPVRSAFDNLLERHENSQRVVGMANHSTERYLGAYGASEPKCRKSFDLHLPQCLVQVELTARRSQTISAGTFALPAAVNRLRNKPALSGVVMKTLKSPRNETELRSLAAARDVRWSVVECPSKAKRR